MIRIPADAGRNIQAAFEDTEARLRALEARDNGVRPEHIEAVQTQLTEAVQTLSTKPTYLEPNDVFRGSGDAHALGYVPDPESVPGAYRFLNENGQWVWAPALQWAGPSGLSDNPHAAQTFGLTGSLAVTGGLQADSLYVRRLQFAQGSSTSFPSTMTVVAGTLLSGTIADVISSGGGEVLIGEVGTAPGWDVIFDFDGLTGTPTLTFVIAYYTGNHDPDVEIYNYGTASWDTVAYLADNATNFQVFTVNMQPAYVSGVGAARVRLYHVVGGNTSHRLHIDYIAMNTSGVSGSLSASNVTTTPVVGAQSFFARANAIGTPPTLPNVQASLDELDTESLIQVTPLGSGGTSLDQRYHNVMGSIALLGALSADNVRCRNAQVYGRLDAVQLTGMQPFCIGFSSGQYFTTGGQNLTSYDYTFPAGDLQLGDVIHIWAGSALQGTTAGTKSLTVAFGTGTPITVFSVTLTTNNTIFTTHIWAVVRSTTSIAVNTTTNYGVSATAPTWYWVNAGQTVSNITTASQLVRWVGTHTGANNEMRMTDYHIRVYRSGGYFTLV